MPQYHDSDAHRDSDDLFMFRRREAERESRRKVRELDCQFCFWMAVVFVAAVTLTLFR